jgi:hypothetical protein
LDDARLPETMRAFTIPAMDVARAKVSAPDIGTALGIGYGELDKWRKEHPEWESRGICEVEVFRSEPPAWMEFEKWDGVRKKEMFRDIREAKAFQTEFEIFKMPACRVIGKERSLPLHGEDPLPAQSIWEELMKLGNLERLGVLPQVVPDSNFGWTCDYVAETDCFGYLASVVTPAGTPVPEGFQFRDVPETLVAVGKWGDEIGDIVERLKARDFEAAWGVAGCGWNAELYLKMELENPPPTGNKVGCRWVVPCKRKE